LECLAAAHEADAHLLGRRSDTLAPDALEGANRRDVQRVLQGSPNEDRATLPLVGVARRPVLAAIELGRDVEQEAARREPLGVERSGVQDGLPCRAGVSGAITGDVVLGFELAAGEVVAAIACAAGIRQDVAGR
jgi:hypothetical protein